MENLIEAIAQVSPDIRYVAIYQNDKLESWQRAAISESSSNESDKYEELLVNPTILLLAQQKGNIDCGGLDFVLIKYGSFYQLVKQIDKGHISICIDKSAEPISLEKEISKVLSIRI